MEIDWKYRLCEKLKGGNVFDDIIFFFFASWRFVGLARTLFQIWFKYPEFLWLCYQDRKKGQRVTKRKSWKMLRLVKSLLTNW